MVDVQHGSLSTFENDLLVVVQCLVDQYRGIADVLADLVPPADHLLVQGFSRAAALLGIHHVQEVLLVRKDERDLLLQEVVLEKVPCPESDPGDLILIGGSDSLLGGTDIVLSAVFLLCSVQLFVISHDEMGPVGNPQTVDGTAVGEDLIDLLSQFLKVDNYSVPDNGQFPGPYDS